MRSEVKIVLAMLLLAGCQTSQPTMLFSPISTNPTVSFETAKAICTGRTQQTYVVAPPIGGASTPVYRPYGSPAPSVGQSVSEFGDALGDLASSMQRRAAMQDVYVGCMAEQGWALSPS